jgi:hypothetical protein
MGVTMKSFSCWAISAALVSVSTPAVAEPNWLVQPIQVGPETVRYQQGVPTLDLEMNDGVAQVTPLAFDHGSLVFSVAVYNDSERPANFGIENATVLHENRPIGIFTKDDLVKKAKNRAMWTQIGLGVLGGLAAGAAASQRDYYSSTWMTPRGTYRSWFDAPSAAGQFEAAAITAGTVYGIAAVQNQLDRTVAMLGNSVVQLTTIDPGESYAGKIVLAKIAPKSFPSRVNLTINWNGEAYPFTFQVAKPGTSTPTFTALTRKSDLIDFRALRATKQNAAELRAAPEVPLPSSGIQTVAMQDRAPDLPVKKLPQRQLQQPQASPHVWCVTCR